MIYHSFISLLYISIIFTELITWIAFQLKLSFFYTEGVVWSKISENASNAKLRKDLTYLLLLKNFSSKFQSLGGKIFFRCINEESSKHEEKWNNERRQWRNAKVVVRPCKHSLEGLQNAVQLSQPCLEYWHRCLCSAVEPQKLSFLFWQSKITAKWAKIERSYFSCINSRLEAHK